MTGRAVDRILDGLTHACALAGVAFVARSASLSVGWENVPAVAAVDDAPSLSIVVPARNEERTIERCVRSLLAQTLNEYEIVVVDDRSDDATPDILRALVDELAAGVPAGGERQPPNARLRVVRGEPLPAGWVGKPWALAQGALAATGDWLLFTDADTWHAPYACASALAFARARKLDALTLVTYQELGSLGERLALPTILGLVLFAVGPVARINDPADPDHALANGQYVLVSRAAHEALGGYDALRGEIVEDLAFARRLKRDGRFRLLLAGGEDLVSVRMYRSLRELWDGFTKNMYLGAEGDVRALFGGTAVLSLLSVVPAALAADALVRRRPARAVEALLCLASGIAVQAAGMRRTRQSPALAWFAPAGYALTAAIIVNSTVRVLSGRGVAWRGRRYTGRAGGETP